MFEDVIRRLRVLIFTRALVVTLLLGSFYVFQVEGLKLLSLSVFSYFIVSLYALTIIYAASLRFINKLSSFTVLAGIQIFIDVITEAILVYLTGGIESWFAFTFLLTIISASVVLNRQISFYAASLSSILYGVIMEFQFYGILSTYTGNIFNARDYLYNIFIYITAFYLVAILSGYLAERLKVVTQTLKKRDEYIDNLKTLSKDIVESMPSGVFTTDLKWRIVTFNVSAQKITGRTIAEGIGKTPQDIFPFLENTHDPFDRIEGKIQRQGKTMHIGIRFSRLENSEGMPIGMIGVFQDLTKI
ncbi:MAG: PAS domain-containing protein [Candidatus Mariimomonas ferrooxydans]